MRNLIFDCSGEMEHKNLTAKQWCRKYDLIYAINAGMYQMDQEGNILFIFSRTPFSMHDLNNILIELPIKIDCAQHLEGGPEASLFFDYDGLLMEQMGSYETGFNTPLLCGGVVYLLEKLPLYWLRM